MAIKTYDKELVDIAIHESAHAVVSYALGFKIIQVSVKNGFTVCDIRTGPNHDLASEKKRIKFYLAPWLNANNNVDGCDDDFQEVRELFARLDPGIRNLVFAQSVRETNALLREKVTKRQIDTLAAVLLERETLSGPEVCAILDQAAENEQNPYRPPIESLVVKSHHKSHTITNLDYLKMHPIGKLDRIDTARPYLYQK
jgi:hypothetical protein